jgi:hypothetical protein
MNNNKIKREMKDCQYLGRTVENYNHIKFPAQESNIYMIFFLWLDSPICAWASRFHGHTHLRHTTVGRTPLGLLVGERPKTHVLDRTATGIG